MGTCPSLLYLQDKIKGKVDIVSQMLLISRLLLTTDRKKIS